MDLLPRMMRKIDQCLKAQWLYSLNSDSNLEDIYDKNVFQQGPLKPTTVAFPKSFQRVLDQEWNNPNQQRHSFCITDKLYCLPKKAMQTLKIPVVDTPVVALSAPSTLPLEVDSDPKNFCDRKAVTAQADLRVHFLGLQGLLSQLNYYTGDRY